MIKINSEKPGDEPGFFVFFVIARNEAGCVGRETKQSHAIQGEDAKFAIASPLASGSQ